MTESRLIAAQYDSTCISCEGPVHTGMEVHWTPGVGVWHKDCKRPKNLSLYIKEANRREVSLRDKGLL